MPTAKRSISSRVTIKNPRPRKYASAAERQKALRERFPTLCVRVEQEQADFMKRIADEQGRTLQDVHLAFIKYANGRGNQWLTQGLKGFAPLPRFEETPKENPMKRKPTPAQIAARERFAEMARSGAFKKKARKKNPSRSGIGFEGYDPYASRDRLDEYRQKSDAELRYIMQDAGEAARAQRGMSSEAKYLDQVNDAATVLYERKMAGKAKRNPRASNPIKKFIVYTETKPGNWKQVRVTENLDVAKDLAKSNAESGYPSIVEDATGAIVYTPKVASNPIILVSDKPSKRKANPVKPKKQRMLNISWLTAGGQREMKSVPIDFVFTHYVGNVAERFFVRTENGQLIVSEYSTGGRVGQVPYTMRAAALNDREAAKRFLGEMLSRIGAERFRSAVKQFDPIN